MRYSPRNRTIGDPEEPSINLTPLIDVVFVILIMFILVAPLLEIENIRLAEAPVGGKDLRPVAKEAGPISLRVFADDTIKLNDYPVTIENLKNLLIQAKKDHPLASPVLFQDQRARFGTYQSVKNALETAGFEEVDLVLKPGG